MAIIKPIKITHNERGSYRNDEEVRDYRASNSCLCAGANSEAHLLSDDTKHDSLSNTLP